MHINVHTLFQTAYHKLPVKIIYLRTLHMYIHTIHTVKLYMYSHLPFFAGGTDKAAALSLLLEECPSN